MTRAEHLAWAKARALEYVKTGDLDQAITSMASDLLKHEGWDLSLVGTMVMVAHTERKTPESVTKWIRGWN